MMRTLYLPTLAGLMLAACGPLIEPQSTDAESPPVIVEDVDTAQPIETAEPEVPAPSNVAQRKNTCLRR